ncbi:hypothetical protein FHS11_001071 [Mucilaginibacter gotjawali]|uniref:Uncharacterized protein n=1 Tax=Mucilaginibacter gotjawali TaxID=1550579 RepID=A0A839S949_9SPHI|nr:hypothetical protein [Mucilaginibacter gotjawali]
MINSIKINSDRILFYLWLVLMGIIFLLSGTLV